MIVLSIAAMEFGTISTACRHVRVRVGERAQATSGASSQPALCVPYVSAMSTYCRSGQEYADFPPCHVCVAFIRLSLSGAQPLSRFAGLANKVDDTRVDAEQLGQPRIASLFLVDQGTFARPQRGASTLFSDLFTGCGNKVNNSSIICMNTFYSSD